MAVNRGKKFETIIKEAFERVPEVSIDRIPDQTMGHKGASNICDFIVYKKPYQYYIECKSVHGNTLSIHSIPKPDKKGVLHGFYGNITDTQWEGLVEKSKIPGVAAGILCWWIDLDETWFIPIGVLQDAREVMGDKSINLKHPHMQSEWVFIPGEKKRVFFDYDMSKFFEYMSNFFKFRY